MTSLAFDPATARYVSLATYRRDGSEVLTPVWLAQAGQHYYLFSYGEAFKVKRIRVNPQAKIAPCDIKGTVNGPWIEVRARVVTEQPLIDAAYAALRRKYGWQIGVLNFFSTLSGKIKQRAVIELQAS